MTTNRRDADGLRPVDRHWSQNLMHASLAITDSINSVLTEKDLSERIASLRKNGNQRDLSQGFTPAQLEQLRELLAGTG